MNKGPEANPTGVNADRPSDEAVVDKTGRGWDDWFELLDDWDGQVRSHPDIARWLTAEHAVDGWWAQSITVAYERARGLRAPGQGRDGKYTVGISRTVGVPVVLPVSTRSTDPDRPVGTPFLALPGPFLGLG